MKYICIALILTLALCTQRSMQQFPYNHGPHMGYEPSDYGRGSAYGYGREPAYGPAYGPENRYLHGSEGESALATAAGAEEPEYSEYVN